MSLSEMLNASERHFLKDGLGLGKSSVDDVDWMKQVRAEMEMEFQVAQVDTRCA